TGAAGVGWGRGPGGNGPSANVIGPAVDDRPKAVRTAADDSGRLVPPESIRPIANCSHHLRGRFRGPLLARARTGTSARRSSRRGHTAEPAGRPGRQAR